MGLVLKFLILDKCIKAFIKMGLEMDKVNVVTSMGTSILGNGKIICRMDTDF